MAQVVYKIIVVGDAGVGKTSLARRYCTGQFNETYIFTLGVDFFSKEIVIQGHPVKLVIYDTGGQERFDFIRGLYFEGAAGAVITYDVTSRRSFERVDFWIEQVHRRCEGIPMILVANKVDLGDQREVSREEGQQRATKGNMPFVETSAKIDYQVEEVFQRLAEKIYETFESRRIRDL